MWKPDKNKAGRQATRRADEDLVATGGRAAIRDARHLRRTDVRRRAVHADVLVAEVHRAGERVAAVAERLRDDGVADGELAQRVLVGA